MSNEAPKAAIVSQPEHHGTGRSKFTTFKIEADFGNEQKSTVRRRYSDFYWLQQQLLQERAGVIVPVYAHKTAPNIKIKFEEDFVNDRATVLGRFMTRVVDHSDLADATCLFQFLTLNPRDWVKVRELGDAEAAAAKRATSGSSIPDDESSAAEDANTIVIDAAELATQPAQEKKRGWGQWMKDTRTKIAISRGTYQLEETPVEQKKRTDLEEYVDHLETCVQILSADVKGLIEAQEATAGKMQTMGAAFNELWGEHTLQNTSSSNMYQKVGDSWASLSRMTEKQAGVAKKELNDPLEELALEVLALKQTLAKRKSLLVEYTKAVKDNRTLQQQFEKLKYRDLSGAQQEQFFVLEKEMKASDMSLAKLKSFMDVVTYRLDRDVDRFRCDFHEQMRSVLHQFHASQFDFYANSVTTAWQAPLPFLKPDKLDAAPSQPQLKVAAVAPTLKVYHTTTGAQVSFGDQEAPTNSETYTPAPASQNSSHKSVFDRSFDPSAPPPAAFFSAAPPPENVPVMIVPDFSDDDDVFGSHSILGEAPVEPTEKPPLPDDASPATLTEEDFPEPPQAPPSPPPSEIASPPEASPEKSPTDAIDDMMEPPQTPPPSDPTEEGEVMTSPSQAPPAPADAPPPPPPSPGA
jgi:PX domain